MDDIKTLLAYWIDQKAKADADLQTKQAALTSAQKGLATQREKLSKANQELAALVKNTAQIRGDLAEAATPADVDALAAKLAKAISDTRAKQAEIIGIEAAIDGAQTALDLATADVASATARSAAVVAALDAADQDKDSTKVGAGQAVRTANSVRISGLTGHPYIVNDKITATGMTDTSFNGTFTIGAVTDTSITYPQTQVAVVGSGQAVRASNSVTITGLTGRPFIVNEVITVVGMTDASFNGTFTIGAVTATSITYPQAQADATSGGGVIGVVSVPVGSGQAVRASKSVTISGLTGHPFIGKDVISVTGMTDASFNGTFTIGEVTDNSITYPQAQADATSGGGVIAGVIPDATSGGGVVFGSRALRLRHKLTQPPLSTLVAAATAALAAKPWTDAMARIEKDIPLELRNCAKERAKVELKGLDNDNKEADATADLLGTGIGKPGNQRRLFDKADAKLRDYVVNAKGRLDQALAIAARVADPKQNPLTTAENFSIHSQKPDGTPDAALQTKRNAAAAAREAVATAQIDVDAKQTGVAIARLEALAKDVDADPEADVAVKEAKTKLAAAQATLATKVAAFTSSMQTDLTGWETAVPDTAWRNLADFEEANRLLDALKTDPAPPVTAMDKPEADLVAALIPAEKSGRTLSRLTSEAAKAAAKARFDTGSLLRRALGALRGDS